MVSGLVPVVTDHVIIWPLPPPPRPGTEVNCRPSDLQLSTHPSEFVLSFGLLTSFLVGGVGCGEAGRGGGSDAGSVDVGQWGRAEGPATSWRHGARDLMSP